MPANASTAPDPDDMAVLNEVRIGILPKRAMMARRGRTIWRNGRCGFRYASVNGGENDGSSVTRRLYVVDLLVSPSGFEPETY
jgi:hypothetical protein